MSSIVVLGAGREPLGHLLRCVVVSELSGEFHLLSAPELAPELAHERLRWKIGEESNRFQICQNKNDFCLKQNRPRATWIGHTGLGGSATGSGELEADGRDQLL